jgi:hypothetical protein
MALAAFVAGANGEAGDKKSKVALTDEQFARFVGEDAKFIAETLKGASGKLSKQDLRKVQHAAVMIETYAEFSKHPQAGDARHNAANVNTAAKKGNLDAARAAASGLYPKVQTVKLKLDDVVKPVLKNYMVLFASPKVGGFGVEQELSDVEDSKDKLTGPQFARLSDLGLKIELIAEAAPRFAPEKDEKDMTKANWLKFTSEFRDNAEALHGAAAAKDETKTRAAVTNLGKTCVKCHDVFK